MQNPYETNPHAEENTKAKGCGWVIPFGIALVVLIAFGGGMLVYRMKMQAAIQREQAVRAMLEAERARAEAESAAQESPGAAAEGGSTDPDLNGQQSPP